MFRFLGLIALAFGAWLMTSTSALAAEDYFLPRLRVLGGEAGSGEARSGDLVYRLDVAPVQVARVRSPLRGEITYASRVVELRIDDGALLYRSDALMNRSHIVYCSPNPLAQVAGQACAVDENNDGAFDRLWLLPGAVAFNGGYASRSTQTLPPGAIYEETTDVFADGMAFAIMYRPLSLRNYGASADFTVMALQGGELRRLGFEFDRSDFTRANPPQVEFAGVRLEVSTDAARTLRYRVIATPTPGSTVEQSFPIPIPVAPPSRQ